MRFWPCALLTLAFACGSSRPEVAPPLAPAASTRIPSTARPSPCARAIDLRSRIDGLARAGALDHALRTLDRADALCPEREGPWARVRARLGGALGLDAPPPSPGSAAAALRTALNLPSSVAANVARSAALVALERAEGVPVTADVVRWKSDGLAAWSPDGHWAVVRGTRERRAMGDEAHDLVTVFSRPERLPVLRFDKVVAHLGEDDPRWAMAEALAETLDVGDHGVVLVGQGDGSVLRVDLATGKATTAALAKDVRSPNAPAVARCFPFYPTPSEKPATALSADGDLVATVRPEGGIALYRASTGTELTVLPAPNARGSAVDEEHPQRRVPCLRSSITELSFVQGGSVLLARSGTGATAWSTKGAFPTVRVPPALATQSHPSSVGPDGWQTFDAVTGAPRERLPFAAASDVLPVRGVALNAAANAVAVDVGTVLVARDQQPPLRFDTGRPASPGMASPLDEPLTFDASGRHAALATYGRVLWFDLDDGRTVTVAKGRAVAVAFAPSGVFATSADAGGVALWKAEDATPLRMLDAAGATIRGLAFSRDGHQLAAGDDRGVVRVWHLPDGARVGADVPVGGSRAVVGLVFDDVGRSLYALAGDGHAVTWTLPGGVPIAATLRPFEDARFLVTTHSSSASPPPHDLAARIDVCPEAVVCPSPPCPHLWDAFPALTNDCAVTGNVLSGTLTLTPNRDPHANVVLLPLNLGRTIVVQAASPDVVEYDRNGRAAKARLLSGETVPIAPEAGYGAIETLGDPVPLECRVGHWVFPWEACRELLEGRGLVRAALTGDDAFRDE